MKPSLALLLLCALSLTVFSETTTSTNEISLRFRSKMGLQDTPVRADKNPELAGTVKTLNDEVFQFIGKNNGKECKVLITSAKETLVDNSINTELFVEIGSNGKFNAYQSSKSLIESKIVEENSVLKTTEVVAVKSHLDFKRRHIISRKEMLEIERKLNADKSNMKAVFEAVTGRSFDSKIAQGFEIVFDRKAISKVSVIVNGKEDSCSNLRVFNGY